MKHHEAEPNGARVATTPLFSSVWLALFNELRKNYLARRLVTATNTDCSKL
jgi:hypothetical protein